ncbi:MAG: ABC transporter ATP-binding protein [Blautia sp.]|nr:ABC transporter ATP-binding protein [Blautia sp.]
MEQTYAIELQNITKRFGSVVANDKVNMSLKKGEILSLLGENGCGKTTLMNMLSGIYYPDEGSIRVYGKDAVIRSPKDAYELGIGMVHQHFKLVDILTAAENIVLGLPGKQVLNIRQVAAEINELAKKYGFDIDPNRKIYDMSVSQKQTVEIVKMLYRGARILILDEPTAVLTPQEADRLFEVMKNMRDDGCSIILITHKLHEVLSVSDRVTILRKGKYIGTVETKDATVSSLTEMMVGEKVSLNIDRPEPVNPIKRLELKNVTCKDVDGITTLDHANLTIYGGEILGIAGIAGGGQKELLEAIAGLYPITEGSVDYYPEDESSKTSISGMDVTAIRKLGVRLAFVPEDRLGMGLVGSMNMTDNVMLRSYNDRKSGMLDGGFLDRKTPGKLAMEIKEQLDVVTPSISAPVRRMSGGNVQKVLVGREIAQSPKVLMVAYPTRGIDINSSYTIYRLLNEQKEKGVAVICVIEDLDVLLELCDRIAVLCAGQITGVVDGRMVTKEEVGVLMTKHEKGGVVNA